MIHVTTPIINAANTTSEKEEAFSDSALRLHHYESCLLCEYRCRVNRLAGDCGVCKATRQARVYRHRKEYGVVGAVRTGDQAGLSAPPLPLNDVKTSHIKKGTKAAKKLDMSKKV